MLQPHSRSEEPSPSTRVLSPAISRAPGKIILAGEHFVVLGAPAVAMAIDLYSEARATPKNGPGIEIDADIPLRFLGGKSGNSVVPDPRELLRPLQLATQATLKHVGRKEDGIQIDVECEIPVAAGLGSSASTTVAIISAVTMSRHVNLSKEEIFRLAFVPENYLHGKPSGVDQATCIYGGMIEFNRPFTVKKVRLKREPLMLICDTGVHHATRTLVGGVVKKSHREKRHFQDYIEEVREISTGVTKALREGDDEDLGTLMYQNHSLLRKIGVSHPKLDRLVNEAKRAGALGAKMTGAGGGGCIIVLATNKTAREKISRVLRKEGGTTYNVSMDTNGVQARLA